MSTDTKTPGTDVQIYVDINKALEQYSVTNDYIAQLKSNYANHTIAGTGDKDGYKYAKEGVATLRTLRTSVEKKRKELKQPSIDYGNAVDAEAKRITAELTPLETSLKQKLEAIDNAIEEERKAEQRRRLNLVTGAGFHLVGSFYQAGNVIIDTAKLLIMSEDELNQVIESGKREIKRIADEEAALKAEAERIKKEREELEANKNAMELREAALKKSEAQFHAEDVAKAAPVAQPAQPAAPSQTVPQTPVQPTQAAAPSQAPTPERKTNLPKPLIYVQGFDACRKAVIDILGSPDKFTRAELIAKINDLNP